MIIICFFSHVIFTLLNLNKQTGQLATDMKLSNIVLGVQSHSATWPCIYGECKKSSLAPSEKKAATWIKGPDRTLTSLSEQNQRWVMEVRGTKGDRAKLKQERYGSVEFPPLLTSEQGMTDRVLLRVPIPCLHTVKLGPTNHILDSLRAVYAEVQDRLDEMGLVKENYHGGQYEGRQCSIILRHLEKLQIPEQHLPYLIALQALGNLNDMVSQVGTLISSMNGTRILIFR